jgi:transcriptional/translational regulatory protein YebC/TACO1
MTAAVPKQVIEGAIARGQGRSLNGASLEPMTVDLIVPPSVALIVEIETDNKNRSTQEVYAAIKKHEATISSTKFLFTRRGRVIFERRETTGADEILDAAVEAGAEDVEEDEEGNVLVWTEPAGTARMCQAIEAAYGLRILSSEIVWAVNEETAVKLNSTEDVQRVSDLAVALREVSDVQAIYCNASKGSVADDDWDKLEGNIDT